MGPTSHPPGMPGASPARWRRAGGRAGTVRAAGEALRDAWWQRHVVRDSLDVDIAEYSVQVEPRGRLCPTSTNEALAALRTRTVVRRALAAHRLRLEGC